MVDVVQGVGMLRKMREKTQGVDAMGCHHCSVLRQPVCHQPVVHLVGLGLPQKMTVERKLCARPALSHLPGLVRNDVQDPSGCRNDGFVGDSLHHQLHSLVLIDLIDHSSHASLHYTVSSVLTVLSRSELRRETQDFDELQSSLVGHVRGAVGQLPQLREGKGSKPAGRVLFAHENRQDGAEVRCRHRQELDCNNELEQAVVHPILALCRVETRHPAHKAGPVRVPRHQRHKHHGRADPAYESAVSGRAPLPRLSVDQTARVEVHLCLAVGRVLWPCSKGRPLPVRSEWERLRRNREPVDLAVERHGQPVAPVALCRNPVRNHGVKQLALERIDPIILEGGRRRAKQARPREGAPC
mmetsp:Transcript_5047/g.9896  ORF Transcript_5047/g.9896 Transcript_5047/m.9896 type:complete len:356 (+) Transcript_5047:554-1621(+)